MPRTGKRRRQVRKDLMHIFRFESSSIPQLILPESFVDFALDIFSSLRIRLIPPLSFVDFAFDLFTRVQLHILFDSPSFFRRSCVPHISQLEETARYPTL